MRAILIDPHTQTVSEVEHNGDYKQIYTLIGCECFTTVSINNDGETIFVDDEGLLHGEKHFFNWAGYTQPLAGKGLILGTDDEGDSIATTLSLQYVQENVTFSKHKVLGFLIEEKSEGAFFTIKNKPVFGPVDNDEEEKP